MDEPTNGRTQRRGRYRTPVQRDADRREAVVLSLEGHSQREIGSRLGISAAVVNRALGAVRREWSAEMVRDLDAATWEELRRLDDIEAAAMQGFEESKAVVPGGDPRHLDIRIKAQARRSKLLGLDAAAQVHVKSVSLRGEVRSIDIASAEFEERLAKFRAQYQRHGEVIDADTSPAAIPEETTAGDACAGQRGR